MRNALLALWGAALASACVDTPPIYEPTVESSHVEIRQWPQSTVPTLDLLLVIDDSIAMASYREQLAAVPDLVATRLPAARRGWIDLRVAVTSNDGWMRRLPGAEDTFVADRYEYDYTRTTNYTGTLADAVAALADVGVAREGPSQPLEAMRHALETNAQFWRDDAPLAVVIITATDDASPLQVGDYAQWMRALQGGAWRRRPVLTSFVVPTVAPRFEELVKSLDWRSNVTSIDSAGYQEAIDSFTPWGGLHGVPCLEATPVDRDPGAEGEQYDCAMSATVNDELRAVPACAAAALSDPTDAQTVFAEPSAPCWRLVEDRQNCTWTAKHLVLQLGGYTYFAHPELRFECRTR